MKILKLVKKKFKLRARRKGGAGSGNWGHAGRPGLRGGSSTRSGIIPFKLDLSNVPEGRVQEWKRGLLTEAEMVRHTGQDDEYRVHLDSLKDDPSWEFSGGSISDQFSTQRQEQLKKILRDKSDFTDPDEAIEIDLLDKADIVYIDRFFKGEITEEAMLARVYGVQSELGERTYEFGTGSVGNFDPNHSSTQKAVDLLNDWESLPVGSVSWEDANNATRSLAKREIINELADRTGIDPSEVSEFIEQWAHSSNDTDMRSLAIQKDAAEELGLALSEWQQSNINEVSADLQRITKGGGRPVSGEHSPLFPSDTQRQLIRTMYDNTQEQLAAQGFKPDDTVRLYRGVSIEADWTFGDVVNYNGNTIESWSVGRDIAKTFASVENGYILEMDVPVRNIVGTARSGFGCLTEGEYIIAGTVPNQQAKIRAQNVSNVDVTFMWSKTGG